MDCNKAFSWMMRYMDGVLPEKDAVKLGQHLASCAACREAFDLYDTLMLDFAAAETPEAPQGFEAAVMTRIAALPALYPSRGLHFDHIACWVWGGFSVLAGFGFLLFMNQEALLAYAASNPQYQMVFAFVLPIAEQVVGLLTRLGQQARDVFAAVTGVMSEWRYVFVGVLAVLAVIQYRMYQKDKANA